MAQEPLNDEAGQRVSALIDGECGADAAEALCRAWRDDPAVRETWHAYNVIGDVLRSEDLAHPAVRDEAFLAALRRRLADEPVVLAPAPARPPALAAPARSRKARWAPMVAAAGFASAAGLLVIGGTSMTARDDGTRPLAAGGGLTPVAASVPTSEAAEASAVLVTDGRVIRDAQLDRYLAAHKQFGGSAVAVPGMVLRSAATVAPSR